MRPNSPTHQPEAKIKSSNDVGPLARQYRELFEDMQYLRFLPVIAV
jgi:hypothetical protein